MHVVVSSINPDEGSVGLVILSGDRIILAYWVPAKFPERARIQKIVRGKPLDRAAFIELSIILPTVVGPLLRGQKIKQLMALVGKSVEVDFDVNFKQMTSE